MLLKLQMPYVNRLIDDGVILRWHKEEGEEIAYGEKLFDIEADRVRLMERDRNTVFAFRAKHKGWSDEERELSFRERTNVRVALTVVASDGGYLRRIEVPVGKRVSVGDLLALVTTTEDESLTGGDEVVFRVVPNVIEGGVGE
jgi:pyruvate/2-oxoglutarate dehydrogenase complex dihydrolipoamide acyltransferase (E2) component